MPYRYKTINKIKLEGLSGLSGMRISLVFVLASLWLTGIPLKSTAQTLAALNTQLHQAVQQQNWQQARQIVDQLIRVAPSQAAELKQYRVKLLQLQQAGVKLPPQQGMTAIRQPPSSRQLGQVPIKRRESGIAVVDVKFNQRRSFEMIVDSGASLTVITRPMATALGLTSAQVIDNAVFMTASGKVTLPIVYVNAIEVGGVVKTRMPVAIAGPNMQLGLLGQDFLQQFDVHFRGQILELQQR